MFRRFDQDYSKEITSGLFQVDEAAKYGISGTIECLAHDAVQSLLAAATSSNMIYIFGQTGVQAEIPSDCRKVKVMRFWSGCLVVLDADGLLTQFSLVTRTVIARHSFPGKVLAIEVDPSLDWLFLGMTNGEVVIWDLQRRCVAPFRIPCLLPAELMRGRGRRISPVVSLHLHPRDIGVILVGYAEAAAVYSFKSNDLTAILVLEIPPGASGSTPAPDVVNTVRRPALATAIWHPSGYHVLTAHDDGCLAFWAPTDSKLLQVRTVEEANVHIPIRSRPTGSQTSSVREPFRCVAWNSTKNPDETSILIAGGLQMRTAAENPCVSLLVYGSTPSASLTSYENMSTFYEKPQKQRVLPLSRQNGEIKEFLIIGRSPYACGINPIAVICLTFSGLLQIFSYPGGIELPCSMLPPALSWKSPLTLMTVLGPVSRSKWLGFKQKYRPNTSSGTLRQETIFNGGAPAKRHLRSFEARNSLLTAHVGGVLRIWDASHGEIENAHAMEVDLALALNVDSENCPKVTDMQLQGETGEIVIGFESGDVLICRYGRVGARDRRAPRNGPGPIDVAERIDSSIVEGFLPHTLLPNGCLGEGSVLCLRCSEVGFVAIAFEDGNLSILDMRVSVFKYKLTRKGPAVIFKEKLPSGRKSKTFSLHSRHDSLTSNMGHQIITNLEFSIFVMEGDSYASITLLVGTSSGSVSLLKIVPNGKGGFRVVTSTHDNCLGCSIVRIVALDINSGREARATGQAMAGLRDGSTRTEAFIVVVGTEEMRTLKPSLQKLTSRNFNGVCVAANIIHRAEGSALIAVIHDQFMSYSLPSLKEIARIKMPQPTLMNTERTKEVCITEGGDVLLWTQHMQCGLYNLWGRGISKDEIAVDDLYNSDLRTPARPQISTLQWVSGTQYMKPAELDLLIGGPNRPPTKHVVEQQTEAQPRGLETVQPNIAATRSDSYFSQMTRSLNERTKRLNILEDTFGEMEESSSQWLSSVSEFTKQQQKKAAIGALTSKLF